MFAVDHDGPPVAPDADVVSEAVGTLFARYPHKARLAGAHEYDGVLPDSGPDPAALASLGARLAATHSDDRERRADLSAAALLGRVSKVDLDVGVLPGSGRAGVD
ncbi:hypothetical protein G3M55_88285 [Streptomyces sp. SID8455]|nr:hypothetical protein [Streptomyces sp. SID8455]